jgi:hypothetical protein
MDPRERLGDALFFLFISARCAHRFVQQAKAAARCRDPGAVPDVRGMKWERRSQGYPPRRDAADALRRQRSTSRTA